MTRAKYTRWLPTMAVSVLVVMIGLALYVSQAGQWAVEREPLATVQAEKNYPWPQYLRLPPAFVFNTKHPRLPHPPADFDLAGTSVMSVMPPLAQRILAVRLQPAEDRLNALYADLMGISPQTWGSTEAKILALGYDWLYDQLSATQRAALLARTIAVCENLIAFIRLTKLSPYNVHLYNVPLQGLMTCAIATYGDDPRATPVMAFLYDLWKNRVLPIWRQVMGRAGGWHEGGEFVGIGIGQAIYQLPNMWRSATGEDLFKSDPALRGFLDFLHYRAQPDGRVTPWGDAYYFTNFAPDALALAIEYRDAAAYSRLRGAGGPRLTSWPWGPPMDDTLIDAQAARAMPLAKHFDGVGLIFARSDWSTEATHVSFRAGDNYWSHSHLDQGAFNLYKGGELAIDSGLNYSSTSDHHLNYAYQSIAHNTLTLTDPKDQVPMPGRANFDRTHTGPARPIANDGGQRRIGSGWGVEEAPMDLDEWRRKRETYHTGRVLAYFDSDDMVVAVADITPAYTNAQSGRGTFAHRTRRAERVWRVFSYDRINDVVVVFDNVRATDARFKKRWLLHSVAQPTVAREGFSVQMAPASAPGHAGGVLNARVLLPEAARIDMVGGVGQEFWVDGSNYDDNGRVYQHMRWTARRGRHPGAWRVEVSPPADNLDDLFLVVMAPSLIDSLRQHDIQLLRHGNWVGAHVRGTKRSTRLWFSPERNGVLIDLSDGYEFRRHTLWGKSNSPGRFLRRLTHLFEN